MVVRYIVRLLVCGVLSAAPLLAQALGPGEDPRYKVAATALTEAKGLIDASRRVPPSAAYDIGLLQCLLGNMDGGVATICSAEDPSGPNGPRWNALFEAAYEVSRKNAIELVQKTAGRQRQSDRAAMMAGLAQAQFEAGQVLPAMLSMQEVGVSQPGVAAEQSLGWAEALRGKGTEPPTELYSRILDFARRIPPPERDAEKRSRQATVLARLVNFHAAAGNDDAALLAAEAVADPDDRQRPLYQLATLQAAAGRCDRATGTATKLSTEAPNAPSTASWQVSALARIVACQAKASQTEGAQATANRAAEAARRTVNNEVRVGSLLAASEAASAAGLRSLAGTLASQALGDLHVTEQRKRALALLNAGRAQYLAGNREVAETTFDAARKVVILTREDDVYDEAIMVPAGLGLIGEAKAGLALRKDPVQKRAGRLVLVTALAKAGYLNEALAEAREYAVGTLDDRKARVQALAAVAERAEPGPAAELIREALALVTDPFEAESVQALCLLAGRRGLPATALKCLQTALDGVAKRGGIEKLPLDELLESVGQALRRPTGEDGDKPGLVAAAERAGMTIREPMARTAALCALTRTVATNDRDGGAKLLAAGAREARTVTPEGRLAHALAEVGAVAAGSGYEADAVGCFNAAEAVLENLQQVTGTVLLAVFECEAQSGRKTAGRFLMRSLLTIENFEREGSTDLRRLARVAAFTAAPGDTLAIARRTYRAEEKLAAYLDLARAVVGQPMPALRQRDHFPLPAVVRPPAA